MSRRGNKRTFEGWDSVAEKLNQYASQQDEIALGDAQCRLNAGQRASLRALAVRLPDNGVIIADEVGMGKTRIVAEVIRAVKAAGGRTAVLIPPGLSYQWQDELKGSDIEVPQVLRSINEFYKPWATKAKAHSDESFPPWFQREVILLSHSFVNTRISDRSDFNRYELFPCLYKHLRVEDGRSVPRGSGQIEFNHKTIEAVESILQSLPLKKDNRHLWEQIAELKRIEWGEWIKEASHYKNDGQLRRWLEFSVGLGLGTFELIVIDEAHKSRGAESGLSRLLELVIHRTEDNRRLAMTATPVELDVCQWEEILSRVDNSKETFALIRGAIDDYNQAVLGLRRSWRSDYTLVESFALASRKFQDALAPYLIRRDKREDPFVQLFQDHTKLTFSEYRREREISIHTDKLSDAWKKAVCAAESLSVVARGGVSPLAQRIRLTVGNGHGIAALLDLMSNEREDDEPDDSVRVSEDAAGAEAQTELRAEPKAEWKDEKQAARAEWWQRIISSAFEGADNSLYEHPAILTAVESIERIVASGEKVLVFGRFVRPLRALENLLNAREMLRRIQDGRPWMQSKVHGDKDAQSGDWPAVEAAYRQLSCSPDEFSLGGIDDLLGEKYRDQQSMREKTRSDLLNKIESGFSELSNSSSYLSLFDAFAKAVRTAESQSVTGHNVSFSIISRAIFEVLGEELDGATPRMFAQAFCQLVDAAMDHDEADTNSDGQIDAGEADKCWPEIEARVQSEYGRPQGTFARLLRGGMRAEGRRMLQLAFNRSKSFPQVLIAQTQVGREGLNLHEACRTVMVLHPEWNPAVVEQQIGRVDRVGSHWCCELEKAVKTGKGPDEVPRIEVYQVVFKGTYDEHNWKVLRSRWDSLRAQLHGIVIPPGEVGSLQELAASICAKAPSFSPTQKYSKRSTQ